MKLREYLFKKKISQSDFAEKLGITRVHLGRIANGKNLPRPKLAAQIEKLTDGKVTTDELLFPEKYPEEEI